MSAIATWLSKLLAGPLLEGVLAVIRRAQQQKMSEAELRAELKKYMMDAIERIIATEIEARRDVLLAELRGESWLQRNWRPLVALTAFFSYWYVIIIIPHLVGWGIMPSPGFGERGLQNLFWLTSVTVGGYMGGRTLEKMALILRNRY